LCLRLTRNHFAPTPASTAEVAMRAGLVQIAQQSSSATGLATAFAAPKQHAEMQQSAPVTQQSAFAAAVTFEVPAQHEGVSVAFVDTEACRPAEQQCSHASQQVRQSAEHAGHGFTQQSGLSNEPCMQHPPTSATGQSAFECDEQQE
jgi:hypothetical protein